MAIAQDPTRELEYVLKKDRTLADGTKNPEPTIWKYRVLRSSIRSKIEDGLGSASMSPDGTSIGINVKNGTVNREYMKHGLCGVENFFDADGNEVEFKQSSDRFGSGKVAHDDFLDRIDEDDFAEIAGAIKAGNRLTEDERKN